MTGSKTDSLKRKSKNRIYNMSFEVELGASSARQARKELREWIKASGGIDKFVSVNGRTPIDCLPTKRGKGN